MSALNVLVVTSYGDHTALTGGRLRRDNIVRELQRGGADVDRVDIPARPGARSAWGAAHLALTARLRERVRRCDVVLLGDVFCLPMMPILRRLRVPVLLDLVDSPYRLVASAPRTSVRERAAAAGQAMQLVPVMHWLLPMVSGVVYISDEDVRWDAARVRDLPRPFVVPNGIHARLGQVDLSPPPSDGYAAWLADWTYSPNRESLRWFADEVSPWLSDDVLSRIELFGNGDPWGQRKASINVDRMRARVRHRGFVDDLEAVYRSARAVVAPVVRGAGVNNKVLEPLAVGRPLLTTTVGTRGLADRVRRRARVTDDGELFAALLVQMLDEPWSRAVAEAGRAEVAAMSWRCAGEGMQTALRETISRGPRVRT